MQMFQIQDPNSNYDGEILKTETKDSSGGLVMSTACKSKKRVKEWYYGYLKLKTGEYIDKQNSSSVCRRIKRWVINQLIPK